jgi:hypothetical protein
MYDVVDTDGRIEQEGYYPSWIERIQGSTEHSAVYHLLVPVSYDARYDTGTSLSILGLLCYHTVTSWRTVQHFWVLYTGSLPTVSF